VLSDDIEEPQDQPEPEGEDNAGPQLAAT